MQLYSLATVTSATEASMPRHEARQAADIPYPTKPKKIEDFAQSLFNTALLLVIAWYFKIEMLESHSKHRSIEIGTKMFQPCG
jgi:hypothetical protein